MKGLPLLILAALVFSSCTTLAPRSTRLAAPPEQAPVWAALGSGIEYAAFASASPRVEACALRIDLRSEGLEPMVTPCKEGMTKSQYVTSFARQFSCAAAVNATPFEPSSVIEGERRKIVGLTMANGIVMSPVVPPMAVLFIRRDDDGGLRGEVAAQSSVPEFTREEKKIAAAVGGFDIVLSNGSPVGNTSRCIAASREPRTAVGLSSDARVLFILVADGRRRDSAGLTNYEAGLWLSWLGAQSGMTLDGGGSSAMAIRDASGTIRLANVPIDGGKPGRERAVGSCLGFRTMPTR
jgi:hypothetical protein